jgi:hypothetical protein
MRSCDATATTAAVTVATAATSPKLLSTLTVDLRRVTVLC